MSWPEEVDVLTEKNIHKGSLIKNAESRCAIGWFLHWFGRDKTGSIRLETIAAFKKITDADSMLSWNDDPSRSCAEIARTINKVTAALGYTEGNPEAR